MLRDSAPHIRTAGEVVRKHEQIQDGLERSAISPKMAEQMNQTLKGIMGVARLEMQYWSLVRKFGKTAPVPRNPLLRSAIGLPEKAAPSDGDTIRAVLEK
ncbi:hypothetical protein LCGC14_1080380 [marine sediment metagenome]|uniref:Uncharacterized protein n=1 Tax=marine sediment metagenome TaxID=412755 RepID=A0A0F9MFK0_9ZZZZ